MGYSDEELAQMFSFIGIDETNAKNYLKNKQLSNSLGDIIKESKVLEDENLAKEIGSYLVLIASKVNDSNKHRSFLITYVTSKKLNKTSKLDDAIKYVNKKVNQDNIDTKDFEEECGVGVDVTSEDVKMHIEKYVEDNLEKFKKDQDNLKLGSILGGLKSKLKVLKYADGKEVKNALETSLKSKGFLNNQGKKKKAKKPVNDAKAQKSESKIDENSEREKLLSTNVVTNELKFAARDLPDAINPPDILEKHKKDTGGKIRTRFPPEPNGFLHIGHAKAMNLSFTYAESKNGHCILRYDDTNPEKEEQVYFDSIKEMVEWLGFTPYQITYSSDYFDEMHEMAIQLIKDGKAYVDFSKKEEIKRQRDEMFDSPYRNTGVEENLKKFEEMRIGKYDEGKAVLRVKIDMQHPNPNMRDFIAYRIKYVPHPHVGDKWCIYPTYDYTHCIVDSIENITHSLCTLEFEIRRDSYYWLLKALNLYRPHVFEFSRLNVTRSMLSKRKLLPLEQKGFVRGLDDPRLLTLAGLRRRGYTPEAIKAFCKDVGLSRNENVIPVERLEQRCRVDLDERCNRVFAVLHPIKVTITNYPEDKVEYVEAPNHPKKESYGNRKLPFSRTIYIDRKDFKLKDEKKYFGLAPNKEVGLKYCYNITCTKVIQNESGEIKELEAVVDLEKKNKPKGHIHWIGQGEKNEKILKAEVRLYNHLFDSDNPSAEEDLMKVYNPKSEIVIKDALIDPFFESEESGKIYSHYQFERLGFFTVDKDSSKDYLVFNRTVELKAKKLIKSMK